MNCCLPSVRGEMIFEHFVGKPSALAGAVVRPQSKSDAHNSIEGGLVLEAISRREDILPAALKRQRDAVAVGLLVTIGDFRAGVGGAAHPFDVGREQPVMMPTA